MLRYVDLFSGIGAFHTAFQKVCGTRAKCVYACDIDKGARALYEKNYGVKPDGDINLLKISKLPKFDVLCAGFPCQPFSIAGKQKGFSDEKKGSLFERILDIIDKRKPRILILENVKNLCTLKGGKILTKIIDELVSRGYMVSYRVIDSKYHGVPQSRKRVFIVGTRCKTPFEFIPKNDDIVPVKTILDRSVDTFYDYESKYDLVSCEKNKKKQKTMMVAKLINKKTKKGGRQGERVYSIESCGPTVCASSGGPGAKTGLYKIGEGKIRTLTVKETLQMFGFDPEYDCSPLKHKKKMLFYLGNSIVVNVLCHILTSLSDQNLLFT